MAVYHNVLECIGNTPLIELHHLAAKYELKSKIYAKIEMWNPTGSIKVRIASKMIEKAWRDGQISANSVIIEPTSGNTGIALAMVCALYHLPFWAVMPESMSYERRAMIAAYGGKIVLTPASEGMAGASKKALELAKSLPSAWIPSQFTNEANPQSHEESTAVEILDDLPQIDGVIAGVGTGGTITGIGRTLKKQKPAIRLYAVEPSSSPLLSKNVAGAHAIQGIGANFIPDILDQTLIDEIITVSDEEALFWAREVAKTEGLFVGISSGAALHAAIELAKAEEGKQFVVIFPDTGERYLSSGIVEEKK